MATKAEIKKDLQRLPLADYLHEIQSWVEVAKADRKYWAERARRTGTPTSLKGEAKKTVAALDKEIQRLEGEKRKAKEAAKEMRLTKKNPISSKVRKNPAKASIKKNPVNGFWRGTK